MWKNAPAPPTDANLNSISLEYSYEDISRATRNFNESYLLGRGAYGSVYKGILKDGTEVAIKVLSNPKESGFKEEVLVLSKFRHPNLVILMGFSRRMKERFLVYELLPGGDLCSRLQKDPSFDWRKRLVACLDAALGLSHLHNSSPKVFHRDIKTQNILLDRNGSAKIADFGLALLAQPRQGVRVEQCSGTLGYADPLYISSSVVTEKSEVYSFGMVLLEVLTGRPPAVQHPVTGQIQYVYAHLSGDIRSVLPMVQTRAGWPPDLAQRMARLAIACIDKAESNRPVFVHVVARLRDLVSRWSTSTPVANIFQAPIFQPAPQPVVPTPLLDNHKQLEEALRKLNNKAPVPPGPSKLPSPPVERWNPFELDEDDSVGRKKVTEITTPPVVEQQPVPVTKEAEITSEAPAIGNAAPPTGLLIHRAVAQFDEELRSMAEKSAPEEEQVARAMRELFPNDDDTVGAPMDKGSIAREDHKKDVARHLLSAGFHLEQIRQAIKRTSSVEAAVEWILEQNWSGQ
jgi:serine/threonine protein kinase